MTQTKFRFTTKNLEQLPANAPDAKAKCAEYSDSDVTGLKMQVTKAGRKWFYFRYTHRGQKRAAKIGEFPATNLVEARKRAMEMRAMVDRGHDPQDDHDRLKAEPTFERFACDDFLPLARQYKKTANDDETRLRLHVFPRFGRKQLSEVQTRDIQLLHADLKESHCPATANRVLSVVSKAFKLAVSFGRCERSPCLGVSKFRENNQQQRFLSPDEIGRMMKAMADEPNQTAVAALKLMLLSGTRREEALRARWEHICFDTGVWRLPETKSGRARHVLLNDEAKALLSSLPRLPDCAWVFPGRDPQKPLNNPRKAFHRVLAAAGIERIRVHDLRHTYASVLVNAGVSLYQVQALLGHASAVTTQRYAHLADDTLRQASQSAASVIRDASARQNAA